MNFTKYLQLFKQILTTENNSAPYDSPDIMHYVELNDKRQERWLKKASLKTETIDSLSSINQPLQWILITEPWCGDAAHSNPFIAKMAEASSEIDLKIQLRDGNSEIENYLTNGGKSIPILVVRDVAGNDIFRWGPRPLPAQEIFLDNAKATKTEEEKKIELQKWYNSDKGETIQNEIVQLMKKHKLFD